jgi:hypothetical protein
MFKKKTDINHYGPRLMPNNWQQLDPPYFSLPTTINTLFVTRSLADLQSFDVLEQNLINKHFAAAIRPIRILERTVVSNLLSYSETTHGEFSDHAKPKEANKSDREVQFEDKNSLQKDTLLGNVFF